MKSKKYAIYVKKSFVAIKTRKSQHCRFTWKFRGAAHSKCNLRCKVPKEIPVVFHDGSTYDYHFITIKKLAEEFKGDFEKESNNGKKITYKLKFIDSYRFKSASLSNLVDNLSGVYDKECKKCKEKKLGWIANLLDLKMVDRIVDAKNVKNHTLY